ncbi:peptidoglycan editing factor PgeF [bacterium]|nr:peptidoglycan editing factor PgeF [bacterium]
MKQAGFIQSNIINENKLIQHYFGNRDFVVPDQENVFFLNQIHSDKFINLDDIVSLDKKIEGDAVITSKKNIFVGVRTADCSPILLTSKDSAFVAAVHSGWRGTYNKIIENVIEEILGRYKCLKSDLLCAIGPSIGQCCYEVGEPMAKKFNKKFILNNNDLKLVNKKYLLNLPGINKKIINQLGISNVELLSDCTHCLKSYFSYRRDGSRVNNQISIIKSLI